ncbi:MAG: amidohydrolase family protein [Roseimicrobium sp.]
MNRRTFLQQSVATAAGVAVTGHPSVASLATRIVDTHTHFYDPTRPGGVPWPPQGSPLFRTVLPDDWAKLALPHGVTHTVVVEASDRVEDNQWLLDLAATDNRIVGIAGNLDPLSPDFAVNLKRFAQQALFRGIRNRRPNAELANLVDKPEFRASMKLLAEAGLELDVNDSGGRNLLAVAKLARELPSLRIVLDHVGGAGDPRELGEQWKNGMKLAGAQENVFCKVSALVEQAKADYGKAPSDTAYYLPILDHVWECFGENRVIFGSNWPVSDKGAPYEVVFRIMQEYFAAKGQEASEKYFWRNSLAAYRWIER